MNTEKLEWVTIEDFFDKVKRLDEPGKKEIIDEITKHKDEPYDFNYVLGTLSEVEGWYVHEGDLELDKSFSSEYGLIIKGNLTIKGIYDDYKGSYIGNVIVLGNMEADHLYSWGTLTILGDIKVKGLILNEYNDHVFESIGKIECKAFYIYGKQTGFKSELLTTEFKRDYNGNITGPKMTDFFVEEVIDMDDDDERFYLLDTYMIKKYLYSGREIFRN